MLLFKGCAKISTAADKSASAIAPTSQSTKLKNVMAYKSKDNEIFLTKAEALQRSVTPCELRF